MHTVDHPRPSRQRGPHNDPSMLDGDSAHGNPGEMAGDEWAVDTDTDVVDQGAESELEDAVADPVPETEEEIEEFEAGAEPSTASDGPGDAEQIPVENDEEIAESEIEVESTVDEVEAEAIEVEDDRAAMTAETTLEAQLERSPEPVEQLAAPIDGYDSLTVPQVLTKVEELDVGQLNSILEYEKANRNRKTLIAKLTRKTSA